jgi:hypothetical protein
MKETPKISRRSFVAGCGALPVLAGIFDPRRRARAATTGSPLRLLIWVHQEGALRDQQMPTGADAAFSLGPAVKALEPWKSKMLVLDGLHNTAGEQHLLGDTHEKAYSGLLTGNTVKQRIDPPLIAPSESLDQFLGPKLRGPTRLPSLELTCNPGMSNEGICYPIGGGTQMPMLGKPTLVFDRLFGGVTGGGTTVDPAAVERARVFRTSVLDYVHKDLTGLTAKLGAEDRRKVQAHLDAVRDLELRASTPMVAGAGCGMPKAPVDNDPKDANTIPTAIKTMNDLIVQAFACDVTRLITYTPSQSGSPGAPWLGETRDLHLISHGKYPEVAWPPIGAKWMTWMYEQQASLLQRLASVQEGDGTLLDHTLILNIHDFSDSGTHNFKNLHISLIGSANGFFKQGQLMKFAGKPHNNILVAVANAMGVDIKTFGDPLLVDPAIVASFRA